MIAWPIGIAAVLIHAAGFALDPRWRPVAQLADDGRFARLAGAARAARGGAQQITIALAMIDAHDARTWRHSIKSCATTRAASPAAAR